MSNPPDWNQIMSELVKAIALEVAAELRPAIAAAVAQAMRNAGASRPLGSADAPKLLTLRQAAAYLGVAERTFRWWRQRGEIPITAVRLNGGSVRYKRVDLDHWIENRQEWPD